MTSKRLYFSDGCPPARINMDVLLAWCVRRDLTIRDFCKMGGFQRASWYQWCSGTNPTAKTRMRIRDMTGIPYSILLDITE